MDDNFAIQLFEGKKVRFVWDEEKENFGRLHLTASATANKYWMPMQSQLITQYGFGGTIGYDVSRTVSLHAFGYYYASNPIVAPAFSPYVNTTTYGGYADIRFNDRFGSYVGVRRYVNPISSRWTTEPLTSITIPASVDSIGGHAFSISCLAEIKVYAQTPPAMGDWHSNTVFSNYDAALYVPKGSLDAYRNAPEWKRFKYIEEMDNTDGIHNHSHNSINIDTIYDMQRLQKVSPHLYLTLPRPSASLRGRWESPRRFPGEWVRCRGSLCQHHGRGLTMYPTKCLPQS